MNLGNGKSRERETEKSKKETECRADGGPLRAEDFIFHNCVKLRGNPEARGCGGGDEGPTMPPGKRAFDS